MRNATKSWKSFLDHFADVVKWWIGLPDIFHAILGSIPIVSISPLFMPIIRRDSGVFLYVGWRMLSGEIPYRDVWDHKPPIIYLINSLGLWIGHGSRWGVWLLECAFLVAAIFIGIRIFKLAFGRLPALLATYLWVLSMGGIISGGNYTTEYVLPIQFSCFWLFYEAEKRQNDFLRFYLIGILCGFAFFLKQNTIGIGIAITAYLFFSRLSFRQYKTLAINLLAISAGAVTVVTALIIVLVRLEALPHFWDAVFTYNFSYIDASIPERMVAGIKGLAFLSGLTLCAATGWVLSIFLFTHRIRFMSFPKGDSSNLIILGLINLPIELLFITISGNSYRHYYLTLLPVFSLFAAFVFRVLLTQPISSGVFLKMKRQLQAGVVVFIILSIVSTGVAFSTDIRFPARQPVDYNQVVSYIDQNSKDNDFVLLWGAETTFNFVTEQRSPSRFSYQYPLYLEGYTSPALVEEFLAAVIKNKPSLIIDTNNPRTPLYDFKVTSPKIEELSGVLQERYEITESIGSWTIYKYVGELH